MTARAQRWSEVLKQFHGSGQTRRAFSQERGIALATLNYWLTREKRKTLNTVVARTESSPKMVFSEFQLGRESIAGELGWAMEIISPMGLTIRSRKELPGGLLIRLLRAGGC